MPFRANGPAILLAQPEGLGIVSEVMLGPKVRPFQIPPVQRGSNCQAVGPKFPMLNRPSPSGWASETTRALPLKKMCNFKMRKRGITRSRLIPRLRIRVGIDTRLSLNGIML